MYYRMLHAAGFSSHIPSKHNALLMVKYDLIMSFYCQKNDTGFCTDTMQNRGHRRITLNCQSRVTSQLQKSAPIKKAIVPPDYVLFIAFHIKDGGT